MAFTNKDGIRYNSTFDPIFGRLIRIPTDPPSALAAGIARVREMLVCRPREELPNAEGIRHARRRLAGSVQDLEILSSTATAAARPAEFIAVIAQVLAEARRAHDAAPDFDRAQVVSSAPSEDSAPVADWVPSQLRGPAHPTETFEMHSSIIRTLDLE